MKIDWKFAIILFIEWILIDEVISYFMGGDRFARFTTYFFQILALVITHYSIRAVRATSQKRID